jgi:4-amino-4-deoxy-L-arabinose transferase-like glycosyltransferase
MKSFLSKFSRFPIEEYYIYIIASYFLFFIFIRTFIGGALERDEAEQILLTQHFALGYGTQPPLYAWLQSLVFSIFGQSIFALALLKNTLLFLGYFFIYKSSYILSKSRVVASVAVASMVLIPSCSWECQRDLTHTVLAFTLASFTLYWVLRMRNLSKKSLFDYLLLGVILALGTLSKYNYVLLPTALLIVSFLDAPLRRLLFNYKFIATILVFSVMVSPHIYWVVSHLSSAVDGTLNKIHSGEKKTVLEILLQFTLSIIELFALYFIIYFSLFFNSIQKKSDPFLKKVIFTVLVLLLSILLFLSANRIDGRWFVVLLFPVVILLSTKLDNASLARIRYYLYISLFFMFIIITVYLFRFYSPDSFKSAPRFNFPYAKIYNTLHLESYKNIYSPTSLCSGNLKFISSKLNIEKPSKTLQPNSLFIIDKDAFSQIAYFEKRYGIKFTKTSFVYTNSKSTFLIYYFKTNKKSYTISKTIH